MKDYKFDEYDENDTSWLDWEVLTLLGVIVLGFAAGVLAFLSW